MFQGSAITYIVETDSSLEIHSAIRATWFRMVQVCTIDKKGGGGQPSFHTYIGRGDNMEIDPL